MVPINIPSSNGDIIATYNQQWEFCFKDRQITRITTEILSRPFQEVALTLRAMYGKISHLPEGDLELELFPIPNGMVPAKTVSLVEELGIAHPHSGPYCSDDQVTDRILKAAEKDKIPYTCVSVHTIDYPFVGESESTPTRLIEFQPSPWFYNLICAVFRGVKAINANRAVNGLLGSKEEPDQQMLQLACKRNYYFRVYISLNCKHFYFEPKQYVSTTTVESCQIL